MFDHLSKRLRTRVDHAVLTYTRNSRESGGAKEANGSHKWAKEEVYTKRKTKEEKIMIQKDLSHFDDRLKDYCERMDSEPFDRQDRLAKLQNQTDSQASKSIFGAVVQELRSKGKQEKHWRIL